MKNRYWVDQVADDVSDELVTKYSVGSRVLVRREKLIVEVIEDGFVTFTELEKNDEVYVMSIPEMVRIK